MIQQPNQIQQQLQPLQQPLQQQMIQLQGSLVNKLIKRIIPDKIITSQFKKQFSKALSIFMLYIQSAQVKKKYTKDDIIQFMQREGLGRIAQDLRKQRVCQEQVVSRKKIIKEDQEKK